MNGSSLNDTPATVRKPRLFRSGSIGQSLTVYLPATVIYRTVGMSRGIILPWLMPSSEYALMAVALLVINVLQPLCSFGLNDAITRYVPAYETRGRLRAFLVRSVPLLLGTAGVLCLLLALFARSIGPVLFTTQDVAAPVSVETVTSLTRITALATFSMIAYFMLLAILKGLRMFRASSLIELLGNVGFVVLAVAVAFLHLNTAVWIIACYIVAFLGLLPVFGVPLWQVLQSHSSEEPISPTQHLPLFDDAVTQGESTDWQVTGEPNEPTWSSVSVQLLSFSIWTALGTAMWQILQLYPAWYLQKVQGLTTAGIFANARFITQAVVIFAAALATVVQTSVTKTWESQGREQADRQLLMAFKVSAALLLVGCAIGSASATWIIKLLPSTFAGGAALYPPMLLFFLLASHLIFLSIHCQLIEKTRHLFLPWTVGVVVAVVLTSLLVRPGGEASDALLATSWLTVIAVSTSLVLYLFLLAYEKRPLDRGSLILILASYVLVLPITPMLMLVGLVLAVTVTSQVIFDATERHSISTRLAAGLRHVGTLLHRTCD